MKKSTIKQYWPELAVSLLLIAGVMSVYLQAIAFELSHVEDFVMYNEIVSRLETTGTPLSGFVHMPSNSVYLVPITIFLFSINIWLCGSDVGLLHLLPLLTHAINAVLLFLVLKQATRRLGRSAFVAALFAIHPVNTENVVSWCRGAALNEAFFFLATLLFYIYYARRPSLNRYWPLILCLILGLLSKPSIVVYLPLVLLLFDFWPLGRWQSKAGEGQCARFARATFLNLILEKIPLAAIGVVWTGLSLLVFRLGPELPVGSSRSENYWQWLNVPVTYALYLWKMVNPFDLPLHFPDSPLLRPALMPSWQIITALALLILITAAVIYKGGKHHFLVTGWFWFAVGMAPYVIMCVSQQRPVIVRFAYLPMIGVSILAAWGGEKVLNRLGCRKPFMAVAAVALLIFFMATSWMQAGRWADKISYFRHAVAVFPDCEQSRSNFAEVLADKGLIEEAVEQLKIALRINPDFFVAHHHLGLALMEKGERDRALYHLRQAVRLRPEYPEAHNNLANLLADMGNVDDAIVHYQEALRINSSLFQVHNNLAAALLQKGLYEQAILHFEKALSINPAYKTAWENLARAKDANK